MARWGWGAGAQDMGPVDHIDVWETRLFDGEDEVFDYVDFVDEEAGVYRVLVTDPPGIKGPGPVRYKVVDGDIAREVRRARARLRVAVRPRRTADGAA